MATGSESNPPTYKNCTTTGLQWTEQVPSHWKVRNLGQAGTLTKGMGGNKDDERPKGLPCVRYGDLYTTHEYFIERTRAFIDREEVGKYTRLEQGDVLFAASGETIEEIGKSAVNLIDGPAYCGGDVILFRPSSPLIPRYMGYAMGCKPIADQKAVMGRGFTVYHIYGRQLKYIRFPIPPPEEQAAIVRFLDHADEQIQQYIASKGRLIALLEEERQALVHQAVTRGLNPNVRLKPSGVEWLGDVPEHWDVRRAKYLYQEADERSETGAEQLMSVSHKTGVTPRKENVTMFLAESNIGHKHCQPGDIVINTMWAFMAALGVARQKGLVSPSYGVYRPHDELRLNRDYMDSLLRTETYRMNYFVRSTGITSSRLRLYPESFLGIPIVCPPRVEQDAIAKEIDNITTSVDDAITRTQLQIDLMNEYRTRLIADVVTGQLDVREAASHLQTTPLETKLSGEIVTTQEVSERWR